MSNGDYEVKEVIMQKGKKGSVQVILKGVGKRDPAYCNPNIAVRIRPGDCVLIKNGMIKSRR